MNPGEAIAIELPQNDRQQWRSFIVKDTPSHVLPLLQFEPIVTKLLVREGKTIQDILAMHESDSDYNTP